MITSTTAVTASNIRLVVHMGIAYHVEHDTRSRRSAAPRLQSIDQC